MLKTRENEGYLITRDFLPKELLFDKSGIFYQMVTSFMSAVAGLESLIRSDNPMKFQPNYELVLEGKVHKKLVVNQYKFYQMFQEKKISLQTAIADFCCMLMNTAWSAVENKNDKSTVFEFFRHIRNASSHKNLFYFKEYRVLKDSEPKRPAEWRGLIIDNSKKGKDNPLQGTQCINHYIASADCILLLWDVEQYLMQRTTN